MKTLLLIAGNMRAGKDSFADELMFQLGSPSEKISFAEPIKDLVRGIERLLKVSIGKFRPLLQWIGTEWGRKWDEDIWLNMAKKQALKSDKHLVVISDVRFINEWYDDYSDFNVLRVLIDTPETIRIQRGAEAKFMNHASEQLPAIVKQSGDVLVAFDTVSNGESIAALKQRVVEFITLHKGILRHTIRTH